METLTIIKNVCLKIKCTFNKIFALFLKNILTNQAI